MRLTILIAVALGAGGCAGEVYTAGYGYSTYPYYDDGYYAPTASVVVSPYYRSYYPRYSYPAYRTSYRGHHGYHRGYSHGGYQRGYSHGGYQRGYSHGGYHHRGHHHGGHRR